MVGKGARDMTDLSGHTVFDSLARTSARLERSVRLASGLSAAMWSRDEIGSTRYAEPSHHTLSLYLSGGEGFRLRGPRAVQPSLGAGSVCVMPKGITTDWDVRGAVSLFHLYVSPEAFDRAVIETLDRDPARLELRPLVYLREPLIEGMIRAGVLGLGWDEPGERVALSYAMQALLAAQLVRVSATDRPHDAAPAGAASRWPVEDGAEARAGIGGGTAGRGADDRDASRGSRAEPVPLRARLPDPAPARARTGTCSCAASKQPAR